MDFEDDSLKDSHLVSERTMHYSITNAAAKTGEDFIVTPLEKDKAHETAH